MYTSDYVILAALGLAGLVYYLASQPRISGQGASGDNLRGKLGQAYSWLREQGYTVVVCKPVASLELQLGEHSYQNELHADFIVRRRGRQFVVIVKRGKKWSARLATRRIRQRFLELQYTFGGRPILFVELDHDRSRVIDFHAVSSRRRKTLVAGAVLFSVAVLFLLWRAVTGGI